MADTPTLPTVTVTGRAPSSSSDYSDDWWKIQEEYQRISEQFNAFAPSAPTTLPEVPWAPPPAPAPPASPPPVPAPTKVITKIVERIPLLGILVPLPGGPAGTGDAPDDPRSVTQRYADTPPPPPPEIPVIFDEPELPPNWFEIANRPFPGDPIQVPGLPIPYPETPDVVMPIGEPFFDVTAPKVDTRSRPYVDTIPVPFFIPAGTPYDFPLPYSFDPGPGSAPTEERPTRIDPTPGLPDPFDQPERRVTPKPDAPGQPTPDLFSPTLPDLFVDPIGDPVTTPERPRAPSPEPGKPGTSARPRDVYTPVSAPFDPFTDWADPDVTVDPFPPALEDPLRLPPRKDADSCNCGKKEKKPKKRQPRTECWKGTYQQRAKGIIYHRKEQVACDSPAPKTKKSPTRKPKAPTWNDTLRDVFQLPT